MTAPTIDLIIPALNEQASLPMVLRDVPNVRTVFVVDNGSTDRTAEIAIVMGATVVAEPQRGYGAACLKGLQAIESQISTGVKAPDIVAFLDGDYSDHPECLTDLVRPVTEEGFDFVLGSRLLGKREPGAMPPQSYFGNKLACFLMRVFFGAKYTDLGPFRVIRYEALKHLQMADENFGWTIEMQIKATRAGLKTTEIPVPYRKRIGTSKISGTLKGSVKAGVKILYTIARYGVKTWNLNRLGQASDSGSQPVLNSQLAKKVP